MFFKGFSEINRKEIVDTKACTFGTKGQRNCFRNDDILQRRFSRAASLEQDGLDEGPGVALDLLQVGLLVTTEEVEQSSEIKSTQKLKLFK
jgi:hypothetical protein